MPSNQATNTSYWRRLLVLERAVSIAVALYLGSSYICTSSKDLQTQNSKDFPYLKAAKGKNNFV